MNLRKFILITAAVFFVLPLFANDGNPQMTEGWNFNASLTSGVRLGNYNEIVWYNRSTGGRYKLSELNWDLKPAWYIGADFLMGYGRLELNMFSKFFFPGKSGTLKDSDWQNDYKFVNGDTSTKTNYSESDCRLDSTGAGFAGYDLELQAAVKLYPARFLTLRPLLSFNAQFMNFNCRNGTAWYGDTTTPYSSYDSSNARVIDLDGRDLIDYSVHNLFVWTGLRADFIPYKGITVSLSSEVALLWYFKDSDHHKIREGDSGTYFEETAVSSFYAFRQKVDFEIAFTKIFALGADFAFVFTGESIGSSTTKTGSRVTYGEGGGQLVYFDLGISAKFRW